jgi:hypothetical protein
LNQAASARVVIDTAIATATATATSSDKQRDSHGCPMRLPVFHMMFPQTVI